MPILKKLRDRKRKNSRKILKGEKKLEQSMGKFGEAWNEMTKPKGGYTQEGKDMPGRDEKKIKRKLGAADRKERKGIKKLKKAGVDTPKASNYVKQWNKGKKKK
jgi:hypothetical protein